MRFGKTKIAKQKFYAIKKKKLKMIYIYIYICNIWNVNVDNIVETKTYCKYLIAYLDKAIRTLVLIMPKISYMLRHLKVKIDIKILN